MKSFVCYKFQLLIQVIVLDIPIINLLKLQKNMGCDHYFHLITAAKYIKYLRPKLLRYYGPINERKALRLEAQRKKMADLVGGTYLRNFMLDSHSESSNKASLEKYLKKEKQNTQQLNQQISDYLGQHAPCFQDTRNHFLRLDNFLQEIDYFQNGGTQIKVSNIIQVQNYLEYIGVTKKALEGEPDYEENDQYCDVNEAQKIFTKAFERMKGNKEETYLYYRRSN